MKDVKGWSRAIWDVIRLLDIPTILQFQPKSSHTELTQPLNKSRFRFQWARQLDDTSPLGVWTHLDVTNSGSGCH
jgi:hypothetical protein